MLNFFPKTAFAQTASETVGTLMDKINKVIINPLITLLFAIAMVYFIWGVVEFIMGAGSEEKRATGRRHMIWGIVGMAIMAGVWGIIRVILGTLGVHI